MKGERQKKVQEGTLGDRFVDTHICRPRYIHTYEKERQIHVRMRSKICSHIMRVDLDS